MAYCTATQAKNKDLARLVTQAGWVDSDVEERIAEGDAVIDGALGKLGYASLPLSTVPELVKRLSILYARYACHRDMHHHYSPSQSGGEGFEGLKKQFDSLLDMLLEGKLELIVAGAVLEPTVERMHVYHNTEDIPRALTMDDPTAQRIDGPAYSDPADVVGGPEDPE